MVALTIRGGTTRSIVAERPMATAPQPTDTAAHRAETIWGRGKRLRGKDGRKVARWEQASSDLETGTWEADRV